MTAAKAGGAAGVAIFGFGASGAAILGGGDGTAGAGGTSFGTGVFAAVLASGVLGVRTAGFGVSGAATLAGRFAAFRFRFAGAGGVGAVIFGGGGAITGAGGTIFGGGLSVGIEGLATFTRRFAGFGALRARRFRSDVFGVAALAVPRAAGDSLGAMNRDFGILAGGCFNGRRSALRFAVGAACVDCRVAGRRDGTGIGAGLYFRASGGVVGRSISCAAGPDRPGTDSPATTPEPPADWASDGETKTSITDAANAADNTSICDRR